jgi:peptidoglycan hydrolase-like protein with peptidoglycan-binding domain
MPMKRYSLFPVILAGLFLAGSIEINADLISEHYRIIHKKRYKKRRYHRRRHHKKHHTKKKKAASAGVLALSALTQEQQWQSALHWLGFYQGETDGNLYSFDTHKAIADFQKKQGLESTGFLNEESKAYLSYIYNISVLDNYLNYTGTDEKKRIQKYQTALKVLGFYHGKIDGVIGKETEKNIQKYKQRYGMNASTADLSEAEKYTLVNQAKEKLSEEYRTFKSGYHLSTKKDSETSSAATVTSTPHNTISVPDSEHFKDEEEIVQHAAPVQKQLPTQHDTSEAYNSEREKMLSDIDAFLNETDDHKIQEKTPEDSVVPSQQIPSSTKSTQPLTDPRSEHISDMMTEMSKEAESMIDTP